MVLIACLVWHCLIYPGFISLNLLSHGNAAASTTLCQPREEERLNESSSHQQDQISKTVKS